MIPSLYDLYEVKDGLVRVTFTCRACGVQWKSYVWDMDIMRHLVNHQFALHHRPVETCTVCNNPRNSVWHEQDEVGWRVSGGHTFREKT